MRGRAQSRPRIWLKADQKQLSKFDSKPTTHPLGFWGPGPGNLWWWGLGTTIQCNEHKAVSTDIRRSTATRGMRRWHCHEHKAATKHLLHHVHTLFTPNITKHLLHQAPLTPNTFYTTHRLPQTLLKLNTFYPQKHLHQKPFTPHTLHTRPLLHKTSLEHQTTSFFITHLLHQTTTYYNVLLRTTTYYVVLQPATKYSDALQRQNKYYSTLLYSTLLCISQYRQKILSVRTKTRDQEQGNFLGQEGAPFHED